MTEISIGICAYNEEENISGLLDNLLTKQALSQNSEIVVICSGCTDSTPEIVRKFCDRDTRVKLILEEERRGKPEALNVLFNLACSHSPDILVLMNADSLPTTGSIDKLIQPLRDENVGATAGRPIPINEKKGVPNLIMHLVWNLHHKISLHKSVKMSAELCAIRPKLVKQIPANLATDEPYMQMLIQRQGYKIIYVPEAVVNIKGPDNFWELLKQRRRICAGHLQIKRTTGFVVPTSKPENVLPILLRGLDLRNIKGLVTILFGAVLEMCAHLLARYDLSKGRIPYVWERLPSTKDLSKGRA